jgi:ribosomal protein S18 acetylase RimI-like enzyme
MADNETMSDSERPAAMFAEYLPRASSTPREPMQGLVICAATTADLEGIAKLTFQRNGGDYAQALERAQRWLDAAPDSNVLLVARLDSRVIAYARIGYVRPLTDPQFVDVPQGWYLTGVVVGAAHRRQGIASQLTRHRLDWIAERAAEAYYFANSHNKASIDLHEKFGFQQIRSDFRFPGATFSQGGVGLLFRKGLRA